RGVSARSVDRRSGCGGTLRDDAARPFNKACTGPLARLWPQLSGSARHPARRCPRRITVAARRLRRIRRSRVSRLAAHRTPDGRSFGPYRAERRRARRDRGGDLTLRAHRRALGNGRVTARQGRAPAIAGRARRRGGGRGLLPASARLGAAATGVVLGASRRDEPRPAAARPGPPGPAMSALQPAYDRFTEGFGTA